jgi:hypothetical protein
MKTKTVITAFISLLLLLFTTIGLLEEGCKIVSISKSKPCTESTIQESGPGAATINTHEGLLPSAAQVFEVQAPHIGIQNFYYTYNRAVQTLHAARQKISYFKTAQPVLYNDAPPLYIAIRILLI